jgi:tRNA pseudouridine32 synthase/23S rRNA pseudouridine746 synthase/23S rRNA pseudouridine1911/1915/1917 synthase
MEFICPSDLEALAFLQENFPESSANTLREWIKAGRVRVNGKAIGKSHDTIPKGAGVVIGPKVSFIDKKVKLLFEDEALVVLEKPEGLLSVATDFEKATSLHDMLKKRFHRQRVFPVHRLDRGTSGVMLFAYSEFSRKHLKQQFEQHSIEKVYFAIVAGAPPSAKGTWESYLQEDPLYSMHSTSDPEKGKLAITHYEVIGRRGQYALKPVTGKKHQLRVHCQQAGIPVVGDDRYQGPAFSRLCLHAAKLSFVHPLRKKKMHFEAPLPRVFEKFISL